MLEGEVSHVEIPRTGQNLGITIVGGADTPLVSDLKLREPFPLIQYSTISEILLEVSSKSY